MTVFVLDGGSCSGMCVVSPHVCLDWISTRVAIASQLEEALWLYCPYKPPPFVCIDFIARALRERRVGFCALLLATGYHIKGQWSRPSYSLDLTCWTTCCTRFFGMAASPPENVDFGSSGMMFESLPHST